MYCYVYDDFVQDKKHERELQQIENRITDLGLQGKIIRLALFRNPAQTIKEEVRKGIKTVVAVGTDETVHKVLNAVIDSGAVLAQIPVGEPNVLAQILGVPKGVKACDTLSQRIIEDVDIGTVNNNRFITGVEFPNENAAIRVEDKYNIFPKTKGTIEIRNLTVKEPRSAEEISNPIDGLLDIVIETEKKKGFFKKQMISKIPLKEFDIFYNKSIKAIADGTTIEGDRFHCKVESGKLKVVVGKERMFNLKTTQQQTK